MTPQTLGAEEQRIHDAAVEFAKANRKAIAKRRTDTTLYPPEQCPVAVFMAGSLGAGKTEASIELIANLGGQVLRIDPDELREDCPGTPAKIRICSSMPYQDWSSASLILRLTSPRVSSWTAPWPTTTRPRPTLTAPYARSAPCRCSTCTRNRHRRGLSFRHVNEPRDDMYRWKTSSANIFRRGTS